MDIGTHAVKLAQLERRGSKITLLEAVVVQRLEPWHQLEFGGQTAYETRDELIAARAIGKKFAGRDAAATFPMALCQLRSLAVPDVAEPKRRSLIAAELGVGSGDQGDLEFDYWPIVHAREERVIVRENVSVLSVSRPWSEQLLQDHKSAKLACRGLDGQPLAVARAVGLTRPGGQPIAALDWGFTRATFCIVADGRPIITRCLRECGYEEVLRRLRATLDLSWDEACLVAVQRGIDEAGWSEEQNELREVVKDIIAEPLQQLLAELNRTLEYVRSHRSVLAPRELCLLGGGATLRGVCGFLAERLGLDVGAWSLNESTFRNGSGVELPVALLGPAVALSALAWEP